MHFNRMNREFMDSLAFFIVWKILVTGFALAGIAFVARSDNYLGGIITELHDSNPFFWSAGNFDGLHYLRISRHGYQPLTHFFFPLYPLLMNAVAKFIGQTDPRNLILAGTIISNTSFFFAIWGLYKLLLIDFSRKLSKLAIFALITFPTSIYFGVVYTESLYLALVAWSFYFFRRKKHFLSGLLGGFSSAVRVVGVSLTAAFLVDYFWDQRNKLEITRKNTYVLLVISLVGMGLFAYMFYLFRTTNNPLMFNTNGDNFGEYRSAEIIILPRVFYRYFFKILPNLNYTYFAGTFPPLLELFTAIFLSVSAIVGFFTLRKSYWVYMVIGFIMPTLYNSFVSLPRYASVLFPIYILISAFLLTKNKYIKIIYYSISIVLMAVVTIMFTRGLWIS